MNVIRGPKVTFTMVRSSARVEFLDLGSLRCAEAPENRGRIRNGTGDDFADMLVGFVGHGRAAAIGDKLVQVKHGSDLLAAAWSGRSIRLGLLAADLPKRVGQSRRRTEHRSSSL